MDIENSGKKLWQLAINLPNLAKFTSINVFCYMVFFFLVFRLIMQMTFKCICRIVCVGFSKSYLANFNLQLFLNGILVCDVQNIASY